MAHILIVDDDELIAELASQALIDAGHACGWVTSGEEALQLLARRRPDILLLDQDMPGMSGVTLLRKIRQSPQFYDLPVIMFTAMSGVEDEAQAIYAGAQDFVRKPFEPHSLISRVKTLLTSEDEKTHHTDLKTHLERSSGFSSEYETGGRRFI